MPTSDVIGSRPDVLVVGGGILGVSTAAACVAAGLGSVLLIETGRLGAGATGGATGLLIPEPHQWSDPEPFVDLERASLERWRDLEGSLPGGLGLVELDWLGLAPHEGGFAAHQPPAVEWLNPGQVAELIPGLARPMEGALIRRQARVNPLRAVARLAQGLPAVATGVAATSVTISADRITAVGTSAGEISPGAVVFATGRPPVLDGLPIDIPSDRVKGHLLVTEPTRRPAAGHRRAAGHPDRERAATSGRHLRPRRRDPGDSARRDRGHSRRAGGNHSGAQRGGRVLPVVLLPAAAPGPSPGDRPGAGTGQRVADVGALPDRHPERTGDGRGTDSLDPGR